MKHFSRTDVVAAAEPLEAGAPHPVDRQVGLRIRMRRKALGLSQEKLAEVLGLTFQQVQKYERAANRVSASRLFEIASALNVGVNYFFEGIPSGGSDDAQPSDLAVRDFLFTSDGMELASLFARVPDRRVRRRLLDLLQAIADPQPGGEVA